MPAHPRVRPRPARLAGLGVLLTAVTALTACGTTAHAPNWVPQQNYADNNDPVPRLTVPNDGIGPSSGPTGPSASPPTSGAQQNPSSTPSGSGTPAADPSVVATNLNQPTGLVVLPDGTALVGERTTGRIVRVQPRPDQPVTVLRTLAGVDAAGDGGLLDLALSPTYAQDGLVYAYLSTATDNRVVHFTLTGAVTPVLTGIPHGGTDNSGRIAFDATGALLTGTGDAGESALAESPSSLAGKILRTDDIGQPLPDNPDPASVIFARGLRTVDGLCVDAASGTRIAISAAGSTPSTPDAISAVQAGADYGWPLEGTDAVSPVASLPSTAASGAGCAVAAGQLAIATTTGKSLVTGAFSAAGAGPPSVTALTPTLIGTYGRLRTVVAGTDGALWLTTTNRDGRATPTAQDDRVIRIDSAAEGGSIL